MDNESSPCSLNYILKQGCTLAFTSIPRRQLNHRDTGFQSDRTHLGNIENENVQKTLASPYISRAACTWAFFYCFRLASAPVVQWLRCSHSMPDVSRSSQAQHMSIIKKYNTYVLCFSPPFIFRKYRPN